MKNELIVRCVQQGLGWIAAHGVRALPRLRVTLVAQTEPGRIALSIEVGSQPGPPPSEGPVADDGLERVPEATARLGEANRRT